MKRFLLIPCLSLSFIAFSKTEKTSVVEKSNSSLTISIDELKKMQVKLQESSFLSLNFEQEIYKKLRKKTVKNKGQVYFKKPSSFRWKFQQAEREEWIYNGHTLLHYFPKKSYAYRYKADAENGKNMKEIVNIILDFESLLRRYEVNSSSREKNQVFIGLLPKDSSEIVAIQIELNLEKNFIEKIKLNYEGGNHSLFTFSDPQRKELKESFNVPDKVKITDPI